MLCPGCRSNLQCEGTCAVDSQRARAAGMDGCVSRNPILLLSKDHLACAAQQRVRPRICLALSQARRAQDPLVRLVCQSARRAAAGQCHAVSVVERHPVQQSFRPQQTQKVESGRQAWFASLCRCEVCVECGAWLWAPLPWVRVRVHICGMPRVCPELPCPVKLVV